MSDQPSANGNPPSNPREEAWRNSRQPSEREAAREGARDEETLHPANPDDAFFAYAQQRREGRPPGFEQLANYPPLEPPRIDDDAQNAEQARAAAEDAVRRLRESRRWRETTPPEPPRDADASLDVPPRTPPTSQSAAPRASYEPQNQAPAERPRSPFDRVPFERPAADPQPAPDRSLRDPSPQESGSPPRNRLAELLDGSTVGDAAAQRNGTDSTLPPSTLAPSPPSPPSPQTRRDPLAAPANPAGNNPAVNAPRRDGITRKPERDATEIAEQIANRMRHERTSGNDRAPGSAAGASAGEPSTAMHTINIRGRADGVSIELGKGEWSQMVRALEQRLEGSADFFRGGRVTLDVQQRPMLEEELLQVRSLLAQHGMVLGNVRSTSERTCQSALTLGMATVLESPNGNADDVLAQPAESNVSGLSHYVYRGNLRSGQVLQLTDSIFLLGDVNPGAQVVSAGDIFIWGRLRGIAHAGVTGDEKSVLAALDLDPTQLRIANHIAIAPEPQPEHTGRWLWKQRVHKRPEVARVADGGVVVEPWDMLRRGGFATTRR